MILLLYDLVRQIEICTGDYKVELGVLIQAGLYLRTGSQGLIRYSFMLSLRFLSEKDGRRKGRGME